ncbi:MAG: hypothetical protein IJ693_02585 [Bacteroidaceae bacterium]|nr:hypothetical protein [Bacteroidaceae bacterium]
MKHTLLYIIGAALLLAACGGGGNNNDSNEKKFQPKDRTTNEMSSEARDAALAAKRAELEVNLDTLLYSHGIRFAIVEPKIDGDITQDIADRISMKMLQIASQNGISGVGSYNFVLGTEVAQTGRATTGTAPQKMTVKYELTFKVLNTLTGDVYATAVQEVMGVGNSFVEANQNAVKEIKNTPAMQKMLQTASQRIISWYDENVQVIKNQVEKAEGEGNYALALALLNSIPEQATTAYKYVGEKQDALLKGMLHKQAADMLGEMEALLASSGDEFNPAVGAYFSLIPTDSPEHATAQKLYAEYEQKCQARRAALEAKAERDEQAARELEKLKMLYAHEEELANIEADKIKTKYTSMASAKAAEAQAKANSRPTGLFGSLGYAISGTFDRIFKVADTAGSFLSEKLGIGDEE